MTTQCSLDFSYSFSNTSHIFSYDLCPLFSHHPSFKHEFSEDTLPTRTNYVYEIALGRGIKKDGTLPAELQCPPNSLICMKAINTRPTHPSEPPRIIQVIPIGAIHNPTQPNIRITNTTTGTDAQEEEQAHLQFTVQGLEYMGIKQKAVFHIFCDEQSYGETLIPKLEHLYRWKGSHVFSWKSSYGCPKITDNPDKTPDHNEEKEVPPPHNAHQEEQDLTTKPPPLTPLWPLTISAFILFLIVFRVLFLKRYKNHLLQLMPKFSLSTRHSHCRAGEYDFLLEDIAVDGSYRKYTV